jgi:hypothetical protein
MAPPQDILTMTPPDILTPEEQRDFDELTRIAAGGTGAAGHAYDALGQSAVVDGERRLTEQGQARLAQLTAQVAEKQTRAAIVAERAALKAAQAVLASAGEAERADAQEQVDLAIGRVDGLQTEMLLRQKAVKHARETLRRLHGSMVVEPPPPPKPTVARPEVANLVEENPWLRNPRK